MISRITLPFLLLSMASVAVFSAKLVWHDEFNDASTFELNDAYWDYDLGRGVNGWGNFELQTYTRDNSNVRTQDGYLKIIAHKHSNPDGSLAFTSSRVKTMGKLSFTYGTLIAKIRMPDTVSGLWPAFWLMGDVGSPWPERGELDIAELGWKGRNNRRIYSAAHWEHEGNYALHDGFIDFPRGDLNDNFHIYRLEWNSTYIETFVDDLSIFKFDIGTQCTDCEEFHWDHGILLNIAVGGGFTTDDDCGGASSLGGSSGGCDFRGEDDITAPIPGEMWVDWIRLYDNGETKINSEVSPPTSTPVRAYSNEPSALPPVAPTIIVAPTLSQPATPPVETQVTPAPTANPTAAPTPKPTLAPSGGPTKAPSLRPTKAPVPSPTRFPTSSPTAVDTTTIIVAPTPTVPVAAPVAAPVLPPAESQTTGSPSLKPTMHPTMNIIIGPTPTVPTPPVAAPVEPQATPAPTAAPSLALLQPPAETAAPVAEQILPTSPVGTPVSTPTRGNTPTFDSGGGGGSGKGKSSKSSKAGSNGGNENAGNGSGGKGGKGGKGSSRKSSNSEEARSASSAESSSDSRFSSFTNAEGIGSGAASHSITLSILLVGLSTLMLLLK